MYLLNPMSWSRYLLHSNRHVIVPSYEVEEILNRDSIILSHIHIEVFSRFCHDLG